MKDLKLDKSKKSAIQSAQERVLIAKALHETITEAGNEIKSLILSENNYISRYTNKKILCPSEDYSMNDGDFKDYINKVHIERIKRGMFYPVADLTFDYQTFENLTNAENNLINVMLSAIPGTLKDDLENIKTSHLRKDFINLSLRLAI